ncbi:PP2C family protein-serine/threonine phosphatase [Streptomyces sp. NPDC091266]|uniref:PP2C family protein-serine/threonine phosphatase n=1 Tax=Streptomyces sp. NPDC091266 TaxID=3365978 RepID=UPI00381215A7
MPSYRPALPRGRGLRHVLLLIPIGLVVVVCAVDVAAPPEIHLGPLLVAAPAITAAFAGPRLTAAIGLLAVAAQVFIGLARHVLGTENLHAQIAALVVVSALVVLFTAVRERTARRLTKSRSVAGVAQQVLLRPLPRRSADLEIASLYLAAEEEAEMGGDLFAASRTTRSTRLIIGDVRGKGLPAYGYAALILGAFRAAAHRQATLPRLARHLDGAVRWDARQWRTRRATGAGTGAVATGLGTPAAGLVTETDPAPSTTVAAAPAADPEAAIGPDPDADAGPEADGASGPDSLEAFATAVLLDIPDRGTVARTLTCGHPPPLLLRDGRVRTLHSERVALPIGLGGLPGAPDYVVETFPFEPGDLLLLYTDGVTEARDGAGAFYPLAERAGAWSAADPQQMLRYLRADLMAYTQGRLGDDAAAVAIRRRPGAAPRTEADRPDID